MNEYIYNSNLNQNGAVSSDYSLYPLVNEHLKCFRITVEVPDMRRSRGGGGQGVQTPLRNHKIGFLSNTGPDPLKIT